MTEQLLLPGQTAAPAGPADMTMMYVLHHAFRRDLRDFRAAASSTPLDDRLRWRCLWGRWQLFTTELHQHHTKEDEIVWPLLYSRASAARDHEAVRVLEAMEEEHAVLDPLLTSCAAGLGMLARLEHEPTLKDLLTDLGELEVALHAHLGHEEESAVAVLQRYVTEREWRILERDHLRGKQTVAHARRFLPWIFKGLPPEAASHVARLGGPGMRVLHAVSRRSFERDEAMAFGVA
jgi:hemerythrin-like domain-containing protein